MFINSILIYFRIRVVQRKQIGNVSVPDEEKFVLSSIVEKQGECSWFLSDLEDHWIVLIQSVS